MTAEPGVAANITRQFDKGEVQQHDSSATITWPELLERLAGGGTFWLTTVGPDRHPHTRPLFAVIADGVLHVSSSSTAAKSRHLTDGAPTSIASTVVGLDIVWTGTPHRITDLHELTVVVDAYRAAYGWDVRVDADHRALTAPYGAPTAGPPPYEVFRIEPSSVHAIATDAPFTGRSTRWIFNP